MVKRNYGLAAMSATVGITTNVLDFPGGQSVKKNSFVISAALDFSGSNNLQTAHSFIDCNSL